ncbi:putative repeat protein (TIGR01451 family) [Psychrobacter sp. PL15]|uniref:hypothetical protein n=1 Tax=Psychrobacter sp. PL15 TaxID=3071719 RepID=UPI002DF9A2E9|nr:putative repeat protein (TIGR01451 family) [Psychrobacter sp. PL15]
MRSNIFNYSLLAVGIAAVLGISSTANAAPGDPAGTTGTNTSVDITNQASASYNVSDQEQPVVLSNIVKITVSEQVAFTLSADNDDTSEGGIQFDDKNQNEEVAPNGYAVFEHTLTNTGNRTDTYTISLAANDPKYDTPNSTVSFKVYKADGTTVVRSADDVSFANINGRESELEKGQYVKFIINAKTINNKGGDKPPLTISAKSKALTDNGAPVNTLTNNNSSFTKLPTFGIVKTITNGLDLNDLTDTAEYQIVVTNESTTFSADATEVNIADFLPPGLIMAENLTANNITVSSSDTTKGTITAGNAETDGFKVTGINIPVGQKTTFLFKVKQGGSGVLVPAEAVNHVTVTDDLDNAATDGNTLIDSTDKTKEQNVTEFYPTAEINNVNGQAPANTGDDSTVPLLTIKRALTLLGITTREIAPTSGTAGQVTHTTVITNTGKDVEGSKAGELTFTITDNDGTVRDAVNIEPGSVTVTYDADGAGADAAGQPIDIRVTVVNGVNVYDIKDALTDGIAPNATATIDYKVSSLKAQIFTPLNSTTPTFENTIVTLIPKLEGAPTIPPVTDVTTVRGLVLLKTQAIDKTCSGSATTFVSTPLTDDDGAKPGECIIYKVQAQNTSSADASSSTGVGFDITNIVILDAFSNFENEADYEVDSVTTTKGTAAQNSDNVTTTIDTLAPQETATMQFSVKIKTARVITTP